MTPEVPTSDLSKDLLGRVLESIKSTEQSVMLSFSGNFHVCFVATMDFSLPSGATIPPTAEDISRATKAPGLAARSHHGDLPAEIAEQYVLRPFPPVLSLSPCVVTAVGLHHDNSPGVVIVLDSKYMVDISTDGCQFYEIQQPATAEPS